MLKSISMFISGLFFLVATSLFVHAAEADLAWDPPEDGGEPIGYIVYGSTTKGDYSDPVAVEIVEETYATVSGLDSTQSYYFIVKAYNCAGIGEASNEIFWNDTIPPVLTNVEYSITEYSVTINGESEADATLYFDVNESLYSQVSLSGSEWTFTYSGEGNIPSGYVFEIVAVDPAGNESEPFTYIYVPPYDNTQDDNSDTVEESAGSKGGGCFITTAAYGSLFESHDISIMQEIGIVLLVVMMGIWVYVISRLKVQGSRFQVE